MLLKSRLKLFLALFSSFTLLAERPIIHSIFKRNNPKPFIVVLDAGHGGHDSGNRGNG